MSDFSIVDEAELYIESIVLADEVDCHLSMVRLRQLRASLDEELRICSVQMRRMASATRKLADAFNGEQP